MINAITNTFNTNTNWKKIAAPLIVAAGLMGGLTGCEDDAQIASRGG